MDLYRLNRRQRVLALGSVIRFSVSLGYHSDHRRGGEGLVADGDIDVPTVILKKDCQRNELSQS